MVSGYATRTSLLSIWSIRTIHELMECYDSPVKNKNHIYLKNVLSPFTNTIIRDPVTNKCDGV